MQSVKPDELPFTTKDPLLQITPTQDAPLPEGIHTFELVVEDSNGLLSPPVSVEVVVRKTLPTAVLEGPKDAVEPGKSFELSADGSSAVAPAVPAQYIWRLAKSVI